MEEKAQGAIEYLLIIGAAVIIAVIVIALMMSLSQQGTGAADDADVTGTLEGAQCQRDCMYPGTEDRFLDNAGNLSDTNCFSEYASICQ